MGEAGGSMVNWAALYGGCVNGSAAAAAAEGSVVTVSSPTSGGSGGGSPARSAPGVEGGRVGKPARRRSRASRRAPVTLLNTDTSNFRAMVQQFTGIPSGPYGPAAGGPVISFGLGAGAMPVRPSPTSAVMSFDHHGRPAAGASSSLQSHLFRPQHQHQFPDVGVYGGMHGAADMSFLHHHHHHNGGGGFESSAAAADDDRLLLQSIQAAQMVPTRPASTHNANGYSFT